jgi:hypothetical protein
MEQYRISFLPENKEAPVDKKYVSQIFEHLKAYVPHSYKINYILDVHPIMGRTILDVEDFIGNFTVGDLLSLEKDLPLNLGIALPLREYISQ